MTTLEIILSIIVWIFLAVFLTRKQLKACEYWEDQDYGRIGMTILIWIFLPIALVATIIRQTFIEDWK